MRDGICVLKKRYSRRKYYWCLQNAKYFLYYQILLLSPVAILSRYCFLYSYHSFFSCWIFGLISFLPFFSLSILNTLPTISTTITIALVWIQIPRKEAVNQCKKQYKKLEKLILWGALIIYSLNQIKSNQIWLVFDQQHKGCRMTLTIHINFFLIKLIVIRILN